MNVISRKTEFNIIASKETIMQTIVPDQVDDIYSRIANMLRQEIDYMKSDYWKKCHTTPDAETCDTETLQDTIRCGVGTNFRSEMVNWCYRIVDYRKMNPETVEIAVNYLDRYLGTPKGSEALLDRSQYQLATMGALYTAAKIHEPELFDSNLVSQLSRGLYGTSEINEMESAILSSLDWKLNPPTSAAFSREFLLLIPVEVLDQYTIDAVIAVTKLQTELAVREYSYFSVSPSRLAFCSFLNALESLVLDVKVQECVGSVLGLLLDIDRHDDTIIRIRNELRHSVLEKTSETNKHQAKHSTIRSRILSGKAGGDRRPTKIRCLSVAAFQAS